MDIISEGRARIKVRTQKIVSKDMPVFYNPVMEANRTISVLLLNSIEDKDMQIADPLAGSGIRAIRFFKELENGKIKKLFVNDYSKNSIDSLNENLKLNDIKEEDIVISCMDANLFMLNSFGFDYIDIDPFGTPNPFLDSAVKRISRDGILAVTATDTSALSGTHTLACMRKYWAKPLRNELMHEIGLRILIRKCQLIGAQFDKALIPIYSYSREHYMRVFFRCEKGKKKADKIVLNHASFMDSGPIWLGRLWDSRLAEEIFNRYSNLISDKPNSKEKELLMFLKNIRDESKIGIIGFYDLTKIAKKYKLKTLPKQDKVIEAITKAGFKAGVTHFLANSIRSNIDEDRLLNILKNEIL